ncbi:Tfp pilus assembly protein PilF [Rivularia sp. PCC 7116]|uniref:tetratricopeptide repeat protein n=1 Tax=Rivularia sp. PCC 7116 TaxID=373994 RepID=UPI00029EC881|nr:tetratricopeptide repeat protein [Rivularia sp. PCC 7116]AFY52976.1 Tfp pilus assembly protein PilF [Rivularia sp. PCC 7116]
MATISEALKTAVEYSSTNRLNQAEKIYHRVLEVEPEQPDALYGLGLLKLQKGESANAKNFLEAVVRVQPNAFRNWFVLGNYYQSQSEFPLAVDAYEKALTAGCNTAPLHNNLGYALQNLGELDKAIASYQKALEIQPSCTEAYVNVGNILHAQDQLSEGMKFHYAQLNQQLGLERQQKGDFNNAIAYYQQAIVLQPDNWEFCYSLGVALQEQQKYVEAVVSYNQALKLNSENWDIYNRLGQIYQVQNNLTEAISIYRQGLNKLNPHYAAWISNHQNCTIQTTPSITQGKVKVGAYEFPAIPPLTEPEKPRPFWTVVIPIYKRNDYILECLANVLLQWQGQADMEILVIDNAGTSPLHELIDSLAGGIVDYYRNSENIGSTNNMNVGISLSRGEWVHVLHDDDSVCPGFYAHLQESLHNCPDSVGAACTGFEYVNENGKSACLGEISSGSPQNKGILQNWLSRIGVCGLVMTPSLVIRRTTHERLGGYSCEIPNINDWELHKRIAAFYDWWHEPEILARFRVHSHSETSESWNTGKMAIQVNQAIEISHSYLPVDKREEITAKARINNFNYCLRNAFIALNNGNLQATLTIIESALKIDRTPESIATLFNRLAQDDASSLREVVASRIIALDI